MFDKNAFKDAFRAWVVAHPTADENEALEFCQLLIPPVTIARHYWLIEQSLQWFRWMKQRDRLLEEELEDLRTERLVC